MRQALLIIMLNWFAGCGAEMGGEASMDYTTARQQMVEQQLRGDQRGITNQLVLKALREVPRHEFVPTEIRHLAYEDRALPIGHEQTISQPYVVAFMTQQIDPQPAHRVLEIGTGSGYQAAILSRLVKEVYSVEIVAPLADRARADLVRLGYSNVHLRTGDGYAGWPEAAPFDTIIVTCAPEAVPPKLVEQLKEGGRMIIPVGSKGRQELYLLEKTDSEVRRTAVLPVRFVPMTGGQRR